MKKEMEDLLIELKSEADSKGLPLVLNIHNRMRTKLKSMKKVIVKVNKQITSLTAQEFSRMMHSDVFPSEGPEPEDDFKTIYD